MALFLQFGLKRLFFFTEATLQADNFFLKILNLPCVHLFALVHLHLASLYRAKLLLHLLILADGNFEGLALDEELA